MTVKELKEKLEDVPNELEVTTISIDEGGHVELIVQERSWDFFI